MPSKSTLVIGSDSCIGAALTQASGSSKIYQTTRRKNTISPNRIYLDLNQDLAHWHAPEIPAVAYFCAGITSPEECHRNKTGSTKINVDQTLTLAKWLIREGAFVIFISSNLVFDGTIPFREADEPVCPKTEYGRQKAEVEKQLLSFGSSVAILRLSKMFGPNNNLINKWKNTLEQGQTIFPFLDMSVSPLPLFFIIQTLKRIAELRLAGITQVSGNQDISYEEIARFAAKLLRASPDLIKPVKGSDAIPDLEHIPKFTTLNSERLKFETGLVPPDVFETLERAFLNPNLLTDHLIYQ